jgi:hypothetical protein
MGRARVGLVGALVAALFGAGLLAGCGQDATPPVTADPNVTPPPTAPVGADGQPITTLCDLLSDQDFSSIMQVPAKAPKTDKATETRATCSYGKNLLLTVTVADSDAASSAAYASALRRDAFLSKEAGAIGGVDESAFGTGAEAIGIAVRRLKLVFTVEIPGDTENGRPKLVQLGGVLLSRANALGA